MPHRRLVKIIIAGGRDFNDYKYLKASCEDILYTYVIGEHEFYPPEIEIVSGTANGADKLGEKWAKEQGFSLVKFPADWNKYGKSAGYIRNKDMAEYGDLLIAFWDGKSKGTQNMISIATQNNINTFIMPYKNA